jgi:precorrin-6B methylase 2
MRKRYLALVSILAALLSILAAPVTTSAQQYQPSVGQEGKDVIWVPTPEELIAKMLDMAKLTPGDQIIDLGSGDGRIVIAAAKRGAHGLGIEYNPDMVELSTQNARKEGVSDKASFVKADIFETDFSKATVITMYLLPDLNLRLRPKILEMKPGTRVVSHAFNMEDWEADETATFEYRTAYLWIVPAKAAGVWTWNGASGTGELTLTQTYQKIEGALKAGGKEMPITGGRLRGDRISFAIVENGSATREFTGRVDGSGVEGTAKSAGHPEEKWSAQRR